MGVVLDLTDVRDRSPQKKKRNVREREREVVLSIIPFNFPLKNSCFIFRFEFEKETCKRREQCGWKKLIFKIYPKFRSF